MESRLIDPDYIEARFLAKAQEVRDSGILGKSFQLNRLFDHLVEKSVKGECPKEIELAQDVFGIDPTLNNASDATVRATAHRLRKKLIDFAGGEQGERLVLKRGEYRLVLEGMTDAPMQGAEGETGPDIQRPLISNTASAKWIILCLAVIFLAAGAFWVNKAQRNDLLEDNAIWTGIKESRLPILLVTGESYAFGELDAQGGVGRLIVDPAIGSANSLYTAGVDAGAGAKRRVDLNYYVLPEAMGPALTMLTPILRSVDRSGSATQTIGAPRFNNDMLTKYNIVYVGLMNGLGELKAPFFEGSRFAVSGSGDEITDLKSGKGFRSDWSDPSQDRLIRRDYAYIAERAGPNGNRLIIVAGLRDPGLVEAAQIISDRKKLDDLSHRVGSASFEALYEVQTVGPANYKSRMLIARALKSTEKFDNHPN